MRAPYIFVYDLETTGFPNSNERIVPLEIAGIVIDPNEEGWPEVERFHEFLHAPTDASWQKEALDMHKKKGRGHEFYRIHGRHAGCVYEKLEAFLLKYRQEGVCTRDGNAVPSGHNFGSFDHPILTQEAARYGIKLPLDYHTGLDTCGLAFEKLIFNRKSEDLPKLTSASLKHVAPALGVCFSEDKAHDALYDVRVTAEVLRKLMAL